MDRSMQQDSSVSTRNVAFISDGEIRYVKVDEDSIRKNANDVVKRVKPNVSKVTRTNSTTKSSAPKPKMYTIRLKNGKICSSKPINVSGQPSSSSSKENINKQIKVAPTATKSQLGNMPDTPKQKTEHKPMKIISVPQKTPSSRKHDELNSLQKITVRDVTDTSKSSRTTADKAVAIRSSIFDAESDDDSSHSNDDSMDIPNLNNIEIIDASESDDGFDSQPVTELDEPTEVGITKKPPGKDERLEDGKGNTKKSKATRETVATLESVIPSRTVAQPIVKPPKKVPPSSKTGSGIYKVSKPTTVAAPTVAKSEAPPLITSTPILPQACSRVINKTIPTKSVTTAVSPSTDFKITNVTFGPNKTATPQTTRHVNIRPKPVQSSPVVPPSIDSSILKATPASPNSNNFNIVVPKEDIIRCKQTNTPLILAVPPLVPLKDASGSQANPAGGNLLMLLPHQLPSNLQPPGVVNFLVSNLQKKSVSTLQLPPELSGVTNTSMIPPPLQKITFDSGASKNMSQTDPLLGTTGDTRTGLLEQFPEVPKILNTREKDGPNWCWYAPKFGKRDLEGFLYKDRLGFSKADVTQSKRCLRKLNLAIYKKQEELDRLAARIIRIKRGFKDAPSPPKMRFRFPDKSRKAAPSHETGTTARATKDIAAHKMKVQGPGRGRRERPAESLKEMIDSKKIKLVELPLLKKKSEEDSITSAVPPEKKQPDTNVDENESDLYFTRKVVILRNKMPIRRKTKKIGRLPKIKLHPSRDLQMKARRRKWTAPPVKECSIVLERDEKIEEMIKDNCEGAVENASDVRSSRKRKLDLEGMGLIKKVRRRNAIDSPLLTNQKSKSQSEEVNDKDVTTARTVSADNNYSDDITSDVGSSGWASDKFKSHSMTQKSTQTDYKKSVFKSYREYQKVTKLSQTEINFIFTLNTIQSLQDLKINENKPILLLDQFSYHFDVDLMNYNVLFIRDDDEPIPAPLLKNLEMVYFVRCGYIKVVSRPVICKYILERCDMRKKIDDKKVKESERSRSQKEVNLRSPSSTGSEQKSEIAKDQAKKQDETKSKSSSARKEEHRGIAKEDFAKHLSLKKKRMPIFTKGSDSREHSRKPTATSSVKKDEKHRSKQSSTRDKSESKNVPQASEKPVADAKSKTSAAEKETKKDSDTLDKKFSEIEKNLSEMFEKPGTSLSASTETLTESVPQKSTESVIIGEESESASGKIQSKAAASLEDLFVISSDENTNLASKMKDSQESLCKETAPSKDLESALEKQSETKGDSKEGECTDNLVNLLVSAMKASDHTEKCQDQEEGENEKADNTVEICENKNPEKSAEEVEDWNKDVEIEKFASLACETMTHPEAILDSGNKIAESSENVSSDDKIVAEPMDVDVPPQVHECGLGDPTVIVPQRDEENIPATSDCSGKDANVPRNQEKVVPETNMTEDLNQCDGTIKVPESDLDKTEEKVEENEQINSEVIETVEEEEEESMQRVSESEVPLEITKQGEEEGEEKCVQPVSESEPPHEITEQEEEESMQPVFESEITKLDANKDDSLKESGKPKVISDSEGKDCAESDDELNMSKNFSTDLDMDQFLTKRSPDVTICSQESTLDVDQFLNKSSEGVDESSISVYYKEDNKALDDPITEIVDSENTFNLESETIEESTFISKDSSLMMEESDSSVPVLAVEPESSINEKEVSSEDILFENVKDAEPVSENASETEERSPYQTKDTVSDVNLETVIDDESKAELFGEGEANAEVEEVASSSITFGVKADSSVSNIADLSANIDTEEQLLSSCDMDSDLAIHSDEISKDLPDDYLEK